MRRLWARASRGERGGLPYLWYSGGGQSTQSLLCPLSMARSWNGLSTTAGAPEFLNSKAGEILSKSPQYTLYSKFFLHMR
jgi:hypothetical protein